MARADVDQPADTGRAAGPAGVSRAGADEPAGVSTAAEPRGAGTAAEPTDADMASDPTSVRTPGATAGPRGTSTAGTPETVVELTDALARLIADLEREMGARLGELDRAGKQRAVRILRERGAFGLRKSVSSVADALGVTRFTVYNYLNREAD
ncbi:helix-turn-helix domain-containing protein [Amycolatopsis pretoriensis]|uniref:helix-turn-helix domain-containing protein n=1 Tax=Amycolatopsis pretoriensis TaxID=218821 RepID=UPI003CC53F15